MSFTPIKRLSLIGVIISTVFLTGCYVPWSSRSPRWESRYTTSSPPEAGELDAQKLKREESRGTAGEVSDYGRSDSLSPSDINKKVAEAYRAGNYSRAISLLERKLQRNPQQTAVLFNLGSLHYRLENFSRAREYYSKTVELEPENVRANKYLGATYYQLGRWEDARRVFKKVLELNPEQYEVREWLNEIR